MKLKMSLQEGVAILSGTGAITAKDVQVLRAGLTQLLKSGKNRVALELPEAEKVPPELLREISRFDVLARELSGRIVLAGVSPAFKKQIERFALPPIITCFETREAAILSFRTGPVDEGALPIGAPSQAPAPVPPPVETAGHERVSLLEKENALLREQLRGALVQRRVASTQASQEAQVRALEGQIEDLLKFIQTNQKSV